VGEALWSPFVLALLALPASYTAAQRMQPESPVRQIDHTMIRAGDHKAPLEFFVDVLLAAAHQCAKRAATASASARPEPGSNGFRAQYARARARVNYKSGLR
jgi:hypothetical protein